ncbi:MAG: hypothetical protein ACYCXA_11805 [Actinomycetes bacterium]
MRARTVALILAVVLVFYLLLVGQFAVAFVRDGRPAFVALGIGVAVFPLVGAWVLVREIGFGLATQRLARRLEGEGALPVRPPRTDGADPVADRTADRSAADAEFTRWRDQVQKCPEDWRAWFRLGLAYDDARDRPRARASMRRAIALARSDPDASGLTPRAQRRAGGPRPPGTAR